LKLRPWFILYAGATLCVAACVYLIYIITRSGDTSIEWMIWVLFGLTITLVAGGYYLERDFRRKQLERWLSDDDGSEKEES
jgi:peptidoglycan/LPS O-acetylase OafA/YrhL